MSEDMDLDVVSKIPVKTLQNAVDSLLNSRAFSVALLAEGIVRVRITRTKQTETTQRWKAGLQLGGGVELSTKIEFSRRKDRVESLTGVPGSGLLETHKMVPFAARYYGPVDMAAQKIRALAAPGRHAARDMFDLHHLIHVVVTPPAEVADGIDRDDLAEAVEKVEFFSFGDFKEQVVPYLSEDLMGHFRTERNFNSMKSDVLRALGGMRS